MERFGISILYVRLKSVLTNLNFHSDESLPSFKRRNGADYHDLCPRERAAVQRSNCHAHRQRTGLYEHQPRRLHWVRQVWNANILQLNLKSSNK